MLRMEATGAKWWLVVCAGLAMLGCESSDRGSRPATPETPAPNPPKEPSTMPTIAPRATPALIDVEAEPLEVGTLVANEPLSLMHPSEYCLDDGKRWTGARFRLGRLNVFGVDSELAALPPGDAVVVVGSRHTGLGAKLVDAGPCPENYEPIQVQMRSDWIAPEGSPNTTHEHLRTLPYIEGKRVMAISMARFLESDNENVELILHNPFSLSLAQVALTAHYEGGSGKPMATMVEQELFLEPGSDTELIIPRDLGGEQPRTKAGSGLHSIEVRGTLGKATLNIEIVVPHR